MIKDKKPLEIIWNSYISRINDPYSLYLLVPSFSPFEPTPPVEETLVAVICEL
jgi:hypothetical protein